MIDLETLTGVYETEPTGDRWVLDDAPSAPALALPVCRDGNYDAPALQSLKRALETQDAAALEVLRADLRQRLETMELSVEMGLDEPTDPIHRGIAEGFARFELALDTAELYLQLALPAMKEAALTVAQEATNQLAVQFERFAEHARISAVIACPACGAENARGASRCSSCFVGLPRTVTVDTRGVAADPAPPTTPNHERVVHAVQRYRQAGLTEGELHEELRLVRLAMLAHRASLQRDRRDQSRMPREEAALYGAVLSAIEEAVSASLGALETMVQDLDAGLALWMEATPLMLGSYELLQELRATS